MIRTILTYPNPELKKKSAPVTIITDSIRQLVQDMSETMYDAPGIGLAAPQIGIHQRVGEGAEEGCRVARDRI